MQMNAVAATRLSVAAVSTRMLSPMVATRCYATILPKQPAQTKMAEKKMHRFWKEAVVRQGHDHHAVLLDHRPLKTPSATVIKLPLHLKRLADLMALEWNSLDTATIRHHSLPLTSLASRAIDYLDKNSASNVRNECIDQLVRYFDTDSILFFAPEAQGDGRLLAQQKQEWLPMVSWAQRFFALGPNETIKTLQGDVLSTLQQEAHVKAKGREWLEGLDQWSLAAAERAIMNTKSFILGVRLVAEQLGQVPMKDHIGVEGVANLASLEVRWQTGNWGEVEDSKW